MYISIFMWQHCQLKLTHTLQFQVLPYSQYRLNCSQLCILNWMKLWIQNKNKHFSGLFLPCIISGIWFTTQAPEQAVSQHAGWQGNGQKLLKPVLPPKETSAKLQLCNTNRTHLADSLDAFFKNRQSISYLLFSLEWVLFICFNCAPIPNNKTEVSVHCSFRDSHSSAGMSAPDSGRLLYVAVLSLLFPPSLFYRSHCPLIHLCYYSGCTDIYPSLVFLMYLPIFICSLQSLLLCWEEVSLKC